MYFTKFFALSAITTLAVATAIKRTGGGGGGEGGGEEPPVQCCKSVTTASDPSAVLILKAIGVVVDDVNAIVGLNCSPVTVIGGSNAPCSGGTAVTCTDNSHGGVINIGCVPVTI